MKLETIIAALHLEMKNTDSTRLIDFLNDKPELAISLLEFVRGMEEKPATKFPGKEFIDSLKDNYWQRGNAEKEESENLKELAERNGESF